MLRTLLCCLIAAAQGFPPLSPIPASPNAPRILIVYTNDPDDQIKQLASAVSNGASSTGAEVRMLEVSEANYKRDVYEWADGIALGSGVYNGNPAPRMLDFINSFDFQDDLDDRVGGSFATAGSGSAGLELVLNALERGLRTFGVVTVGGSNWRNAEGTGVVTGPSFPENGDLMLAQNQGVRIASLAARLKNNTGTVIPPPLEGVTLILNSVASSLGKAQWTPKTRLHTTCEAYCRGWTAAVGCGTCKASAFSFPGGAQMCVHPGPLGTGLLCRMNFTTGEPTGQSCCGVGGPCQLPTSPKSNPGGLWPGNCCAGGKCGNCPGGSPGSDRFPHLNESSTLLVNRRYFDYSTNKCLDGVPPS